jgi:electron transport complex protein RnfA
MIRIFMLAIASIFINNFVLARFMGLCPYLGVSKKLDSAFGMGMAVIFVMTMTSAITWILSSFVLAPLNLEYLQTLTFILTIAALVQFVEMVIQKTAPALYRSLGVYLPLITTNCAVLGVAIINIKHDFKFLEGTAEIGSQLNFIYSTLNGFLGGVGFTFVLLLMAGIRERLEKAEVPETMKGMPIALIIAGCMALAFMGLSSLNLK